MKIFAVSVLLASTAVSAPAFALTPKPVDTMIGTILADAPDAPTLAKRCDVLLGEITRRQTALEGETGKASVDKTLQAFDDIQNLITALSGEATLYREVMGDEARRAAGAECEVKVASAGSKLSLSRPIFERLKAIDATKAAPATKYYLTRTIADYERSGVALDAAGRAEVQALLDQISQAGTDFEANIAKGRKIVTADPAELVGLPQDFIDAHKPGADGKVTISTDYPDYVPVMTYATSDALRQRLYFAYNNRAAPENDVPLRTMLDLRQKLATRLGRPDFATLALENKMVNTPAAVEKLLDDMAAAARPSGEHDKARKLAFWQKSHPADTSYPVWANSWLGQQVQKADYAYDRQEARQYFAYDNVRDGILRLTENLFGVQIRPWKTTVWDPSVESYEMLDKGEVIGRFYFDSHPRPGKYSHGNMVPLRSGIAGRSIPVAALVMNMPAGDHTTGLMEHNDVVTFLHEFGHMLHGMFSGTQRWAATSGINTEWDFVEAPSQMLEEWVYDYDTLKTFAVNAKGQPIPRELVEKMNKARYFDRGLGDLRQLGLANGSLQYHRGPAPADLSLAIRTAENKYDLIGYPEGTHMQDAFGHLNGYSAVYYTYLWSKVIADDLFTQFARNGLSDRATAVRYRRMVLEPGGSKPAAQLVRDFLGRDISLDAYRADIARDK
jgi:thimet oligopeptidase